MSLKWEAKLLEPIEDDESDKVLRSDEDEDDFLDFCQCASDPCLSDWMSLAF